MVLLADYAEESYGGDLQLQMVRSYGAIAHVLRCAVGALTVLRLVASQLQ